MERIFACLLLVTLLLTACQEPIVEPEPTATPKDYERQLPLGAHALRELPLEQWPDLSMPILLAHSDLISALEYSEKWFEVPSSKTHFPMSGIAFERAKASVIAMRSILASGMTSVQKREAIEKEMMCYTSVGWNGQGEVLYTGYYTPIFKASKIKQGKYQFPLYKLPTDIKRDPVSGNVLEAYPSRNEIEVGNLLAGQELVYLPSEIEAYIIHVNGSAKLELEEGGVMYVGYAGHNGHEYVSMRAEMVKDGKIGKRAGLPKMLEYFRQYPKDVPIYINRNPRFIFFMAYDGTDWPAGSLGFPVTTKRSLATDKSVYPRGGLVMVDTTLPSVRGKRLFKQFMMDQDTGGAIRAPGRADIYLGIGEKAEKMAGQQVAEGRLYYFFVKPERVQYWLKQSTKK